MPGNEVGDRIHNFFGQESLSQGQHHSQVVDGAWPGLTNNLWAGSPRQIGASLISNLKNHNGQQSVDSDRGHGGQTSSVQHVMNFPHSSPSPEFGRSQSQGQQPTLNGYMHAHPSFQSRQNEANFLGVDAESDQQAISSKRFSIVDSQLANSPDHHKKKSVTMDYTESPVNYDFFGEQQQISSQNPGVLQSLSRQQSEISDMQQLLQQQFMLKQMLEIQRQQQFRKQQLQQQEVRQLNSLNQVSAFAKQAAGGPSQALINGIPVQDASNYSWQPEHMAANTNWTQRGASPVVHGSLSGHMFSPEQGQGLLLMGMVPQQVDQSLYGVPISGSRVAPSQYSPVQMDKTTMQQISSSNNSLLGNQYPGIPDQASVQDGTLVSRQGYEGKNMIGTADGQGLNTGFNLGNLQQVNPQQGNGPVPEYYGRQELAVPSETSQEQSVMQIGPSQNVATLDPTEEKILFGSDDNLWDAFGGGTTIGSGGYNMFDNTDFSGAFPSMQSGSWSALMQSAVAETSSADVGLQEKWCGLTSRNNKPSAASSLSSPVNDNGKQHSAWADDKLQTASIVDPRPFPESDETNSNINCNNIQGGQHSGVDISDEQSERLQTGSQTFGTQFPVDGTKWLDCGSRQKVPTEGSHTSGNVTPDAVSNAKSIPTYWTNQQRMPVYRMGGMGGQPISRPNGWSFIDPGLPSTSAALKNQGNENSVQVSQTQSTDQKTPMFEAMGHGSGIWKRYSGSNSLLQLEHAKSAIGSPQVNKDDSNLNNVAALPESVPIRANQESSQQPPNSNNMDIWKHVDSSAKPKTSESSGKYQSYIDRSRQAFESSRNISVGNGAVETHEIQNSNIKENVTDRIRKLSQPSSNMSARENAWLDASDSGTLLGGKQKSSSHAGRKPTGIRKFQYHPMGDLDADVEPLHGTKQVTHSQSMQQPVSQGLVQPKFPSHITRNPLESNKGCLSGFREETKSFDNIPSKSMLPSSAPGTSAPFDTAVHNYQPNKTTTSSQNMLELLHKVDQSREHGNSMHFSSTNCNQSSEMPQAETLDASVHHQQIQSSASQGFGLQLAPPSQPLPVPDHAFSSQNPSQENNILGSTHVSSDMGERGYTWLASTSSVQFFPPSHETSQGQSRNNISSTLEPNGNNAQRNFSAAFSSTFPHPRSHLQNQHMSGSDGPATTGQSVNVSFDRFPSQSKQMSEPLERSQSNQSALASVPDMSRNTAEENIAPSVDVSQRSNHKQKHAKDSVHQFPVLEASSAPKISPAVWTTNVSTLQHLFGARPFKTPSGMFKPNPQSNNNSETNFSLPQKLEDQIAQTGGGCPESNLSQKTLSASQGKESVTSHLAGSTLSNPTCTQKEIEAFGPSLRPDNILHQNYSLPHQVQGIKSMEVDQSDRSLKRFRGLDGVVDAQLGPTQGGQQFHGHSDTVRDAPINHTVILSGDDKMLSFSAKLTDDCEASAPLQDMLAFGRNHSQNFANNKSAVSVRGENSQISPQMAPSWFDQYGTFKNGQILSIYDARKAATIRASEMPFTVGRPSDQLHVHSSIEQGNAVTSECGIVQKSLISVASENISTSQLLHPDASDVSLAAVKPKKRKSVTSELIPWHEEVLQGPRRLQNLSAAEVNWSLSANRLTEKVEDEGEMVDDGLPVLKSKRRLILTTQLMQLLFHPPPASILFAEAISHYQSATYFVGRSTLGDACSAVSCSGSDTLVPVDGGNILPENLKASERISDQYFTKVMEDLINRARKLQNDLLRLDKRATVLDLRVECQDLEKYSVINRFAKFHGRGQADGSENSSSSDASANALKACPQRYVTALPMPRNLPDRNHTDENVGDWILDCLLKNNGGC